MKSLFKKDKKFDWSKIKISYGNAVKIPTLLEALKSPFHLERENAYVSLENSVVNQGDLYEAAYYVIDPLINILEDDFCLDKNKTLNLLYEISNGYALEDDAININGNTCSLTKACWWKIKNHEDVIKNIQVNKNNEEVKADLLENLAEINILPNSLDSEKNTR